MLWTNYFKILLISYELDCEDYSRKKQQKIQNLEWLRSRKLIGSFTEVFEINYLILFQLRPKLVQPLAVVRQLPLNGQRISQSWVRFVNLLHFHQPITSGCFLTNLKVKIRQRFKKIVFLKKINWRNKYISVLHVNLGWDKRDSTPVMAAIEYN